MQQFVSNDFYDPGAIKALLTSVVISITIMLIARSVYTLYPRTRDRFISWRFRRDLRKHRH